MSKFIIILLLTLIIALLPVIGVTAADGLDEVDVYVNGKHLKTDQPAITVNGRTMVPLRAICEALNCVVTWDENTQTAQIENKVTIISVQINNYYMSKLDRANQQNINIIELDVPPIVYNARTLVPARAIAEALYAQVGWNDKQQRVDITLEFDYISWFQDGLAIAKKDNKYGFINESREIVIPFIYDNACSFWVGMASVEKNGKWGVINKNNEPVIPFVYDYVDTFEDGVAYARIGDKYGFIDINNNIKIPFIYDEARPFNNGIAEVRRYEQWFHIDINGKEYGYVDKGYNENTSNATKTKTKEVTIMLPSEKSKMTVKVTANGITVYEGIHLGSEGAITVPVTANSGDVVVIAYIDGRRIVEKTIKF